MPVKTLFEDDSQSSSQLPLVRDYCKKRVLEGKEVYDIPLELRQIALSKNEEWVRAETDVCVALIPSGSSIGKGLLGVMPELDGEGNMLVLIPKKGGKLGFSIGIDEDNKGFYNWHKEDNYLSIARSKVKKTKEEPLFKLSDIIPPSPSTSEDGSNTGAVSTEAIKQGIKAAGKRARNGGAVAARAVSTPS